MNKKKKKKKLLTSVLKQVLDLSSGVSFIEKELSNEELLTNKPFLLLGSFRKKNWLKSYATLYLRHLVILYISNTVGYCKNQTFPFCVWVLDLSIIQNPTVECHYYICCVFYPVNRCSACRLLVEVICFCTKTKILK